MDRQTIQSLYEFAERQIRAYVAQQTAQGNAAPIQYWKGKRDAYAEMLEAFPPENATFIKEQP